MDKINKEFGQLSGEELFKPITKRLDEKSSDNVEEEEEEEQEGPDYTMDEFDRTNPFSDEFRPDAPTPPPSPPPYQEFDGDNLPLPPPPLMEEASTRKEWGMPGPVKPEYKHESTLLQTVNQLITKYGNDPNYKVGKSKLGLKGKTIAELKKMRGEINERRGTQPLSKKLQEGKQSSDNEDDSSEQDWETEGSGIADEAEKLINQLHLSLGSIKAGNNSIKLKKQVFYLLDSLVKKEKKIIISYYIKQ